MKYIKLFENFDNKEFEVNYYKATHAGLDEDIIEAFECNLLDSNIKYIKNEEFIYFKIDGSDWTEETEYWIILDSYKPSKFGKSTITLTIKYSGGDESIEQFKNMFDELLIERDKEYDFDHDDYYDSNVEFFLRKSI
jgi:hypothetical protein